MKIALKSLPAFLVVATVIGCLAPFANKAFHMDDPLFLWTARQIQAHPADFYGFKANWYGSEMPMAEVTKNPPLASYYLALAASIFGWSEAALHLAMLLPAVAAVLGACFLAKEFGANPWLSALAAVLTPVFLVSGTNVMCDTMMLAFWVWAIFCWMRGASEGRHIYLAAAAILATLAALTKYFGISLVPLMLVYAWMRQRRWGSWSLYLLIPVVLLASYQSLTFKLYGRGLLFDAASYATTSRTKLDAHLFPKTIVGLAFAGGCMATVLFYCPLLWSKRTLGFIAGFAACLVLPLLFWKPAALFGADAAQSFRWGFVIQFIFFAIGGISLLLLAASDWYRHRDAPSLLLVLWVLGTFLFATIVNWTINARSLLPLAPAAGILLARRLAERHAISPIKTWQLATPLIVSAVIALTVTWSDYEFAGNARLAARLTCARYSRDQNRPIWFQGHWGFQYYMQQMGAKPIELANTKFARGDAAVIPSIGSNMYDLYDLGDAVSAIEKIGAPSGRWVTTLNTGMGPDSVGAGFYSDALGPLPFVFGHVKPEFFMVYQATRAVEYHYVSPSDRSAAQNLYAQGNSFLARADLEEAKKSYLSALNLHPAFAEAHYQLGTLLATQRQMAAAIDHLQAAVRLKPDWIEALNNLAWIFATDTDARFRDGPEAVRLASQAVKITNGENAGALDTLAASYAEAGRFPDAINTVEKAMAIAKASDAKDLAAQLEGHLELYQSGKPLRK